MEFVSVSLFSKMDFYFLYFFKNYFCFLYRVKFQTFLCPLFTSNFCSSLPDESAVLEPYKSDAYPALRKRLSSALDILPSFREVVNCPILLDTGHPGYSEAFRKASEWRFETSDWNFWKQFEATPDTCETLRSTFSFFSKPLTQEEAEFPLAYGMLVYKDIKQLLYVLSAFYQPQNAFCVAVDGRASGAFKSQMQILQGCFPNIHVFVGLLMKLLKII